MGVVGAATEGVVVVVVVVVVVAVAAVAVVVVVAAEVVVVVVVAVVVEVVVVVVVVVVAGVVVVVVVVVVVCDLRHPKFYELRASHVACFANASWGEAPRPPPQPPSSQLQVECLNFFSRVIKFFSRG